jgi:hypothetical protein
MSGDVVHVAIMPEALRELGEGIAVYSAELKRASRITGRDRPEQPVTPLGS